MITPNDNSPWRCPECGELMIGCVCEEDESAWQDWFIGNDFNDPHDYDEDYEDWGREP